MEYAVAAFYAAFSIYYSGRLALGDVPHECQYDARYGLTGSS
jgi:hypothetical protein